MTINEAITAAQHADAAFEQAICAAGYKSRWDFSVVPVQCQALRDAYFAKVSADNAMQAAFVAEREAVS